VAVLFQIGGDGLKQGLAGVTQGRLVSPSQSSMRAVVNSMAVGSALFSPAISGALPWVGSNMEGGWGRPG